ncbi:MAG: hypothetical protein HYV42_02910 [Candidatus Magasanikbacteria bacterium]|nr:hypothetical protein [Candidatus Magasanikbacteria bacterium]
MEQLCAYGFIAVLSDLYYFTFTRELTTLIEQYAASQGSAQPVKEYVSILITPTVKTVTWKYKQALFQLALKIARLGITRPANPPKLIISNKILLKQAQQIVREFYAVNYGHRGPALTLKAIISEVADLVSKNKVHRAYRAFISEHTAIRAKQCRYIRRLKLSKQAVYLLEAAKQFIYIKGFRLEKLYQSYAAIDRLLSQVTDHKISLDNLKRCSKFEVLRFLKDGKLPTARELTRRTRHLTYTAWQHTKAKIRTGAAAGRYLQTFVAKTKDNKVRFSVHGNIACAGRATGTAKIVQSGKDMQKVREGDILVAVQTIPELLPAMKKAAAFVTDIGGITSHAAIVSREMGKPCVIGTRVATQVFKDGDLVEVDAIKGIVQKI